MKVKKLNKGGFTLIELLIVIIIIGILAAIAFVAYSGSQNKAHKADAQSTLSEVKNKLAEYNADHSSYPAGMSDLKNWLASSEAGNNKALVQTLTDAGTNYTYQPTASDDTNCTTGDTVATDGTVTAGSASCAGYKLTAVASIWGDSNTADNITVTN
jgi:type IV pilus assembly protein PilE